MRRLRPYFKYLRASRGAVSSAIFYAIIFAIEGGVYPWHEVYNEFPRTGELLPAVENLGWVAPSGLVRYRSGGFGPDFRGNLFNEEVFVFTPKGELKTIPKGATALDFAFEIHTDIGAKCIGAKVNQKLVPINHVLKNGDQIEILTSSKQKPNEDWLRFVISPKAKAKIKDPIHNYFKLQQFKIYIHLKTFKGHYYPLENAFT